MHFDGLIATAQVHLPNNKVTHAFAQRYDMSRKSHYYTHLQDSGSYP